MFTVDMYYAIATITTLDEKDEFDDVETTICEDNTVFINQYIQDTDEVNTIYMSYQQLLDLLAGLSSAEGMYKIDHWKDKL